MGNDLAVELGMSLRLPIAAALLLFGCAEDNPEHIVAKQTHLIQYQSCAQLETDLEALFRRSGLPRRAG